MLLLLEKDNYKFFQFRRIYRIYSELTSSFLGFRAQPTRVSYKTVSYKKKRVMDEGQLNEMPTKIVFVDDADVDNSSVMICDDQPQPHSATFTSQTSTRKYKKLSAVHIMQEHINVNDSITSIKIVVLVFQL